MTRHFKINTMEKTNQIFARPRNKIECARGQISVYNSTTECLPGKKSIIVPMIDMEFLALIVGSLELSIKPMVVVVVLVVGEAIGFARVDMLCGKFKVQHLLILTRSQ
jgi:hypothetical protein